MKFRNPINLYESLNVSRRNNSMLLITTIPTRQFSYLGPKTWNSVYKRILVDSEQDLSTKVSTVKKSMKKLLANIQKEHNEDEWVPSNYSLF